MKKTISLFSAVLLFLSVAILPAFAAKAEAPLSADTFFYDQLGTEARQIYDALADPDNLSLLKSGDYVPVESYSVTIPSDVNQEQFDAFVSMLTNEQKRLGGIMQYATDATAAFNRDRPDIFWMNGVHAKVSLAADGELQSGNISISPGHTYSVILLVSQPIVDDWDGNGQYDRDLEADIQTLTSTVQTVATMAAQAATTRYERICYVNDLLCRINQYHTVASKDDNFPQYYPWTPLSALVPLNVENDNAPNALMPVCEGYSRAFKLICDELDIPCILITGRGNGANHMWNYVQLEDGAWYAVDVTWNDTANTDDYLVVGADTFSEDHSTNGIFIQNGQNEAFVYPELSETAYTVPTVAVDIQLPNAPTAPLTEGYEAVTIPVHLSNYGTRDAALLSLTLQSESLSLVGTLPTEPLAVGAYDASFTLTIPAGLAVGTHTATLTLVYGEDRLTETETITVVVNEKPVEPLPSPDLPTSATDPSSDTSTVESTKSETEAELDVTVTPDTPNATSSLIGGCSSTVTPAALLLLLAVAPIFFALGKKKES